MPRKNKKEMIMTLIGVITLILVVSGATVAYFVTQGGNNATENMNVITDTTDMLTFNIANDININANQDNFAPNAGDITSSTTATATLKANNTNNTATATYNIYLIIEANDFEYTTSDATPELLLEVTDPNGNKVENITGLVHYEEGFDITTRTGGYLIISDYEIATTTGMAEQDWEVKITFKNLDSDQNKNQGKTLTGKIYMTQNKMSSYVPIEINNVESEATYNSAKVSLELSNGTSEVEKYYYGIEENTNTRSASDVEYIESDVAEYTFTNLEENQEYTIYSYVVDKNKVKSNIYTTNITTEEYDVPVINSVSHSVTLTSISLEVNATKGSNEITKYMYSKDNGLTWESSSNNTYTFNNLTDTTEYKIKVKVVDSEERESTEYYEAITTEIYINPTVTRVDATTTWNSITLTPTGENGTNEISKYMYSIDDGEYQESNVFNNLSDNKEYTIKVKAIDSANRESNVYEMQVRTDEYILPSINVETSSTSDSITINVNGTNGDGEIVKYYYSKDNGSNYEESTSNSYTFNNLTSNTTFYIKVYVEDSNGRVSSEYVTSEETESSFAADYIINNVYTSDGANGLYYHDGVGTYTNASEEAGDNSYRYSGANPNNYVCFGSDAATCPNDNLYRIIGLFDDDKDGIYNIKLIKYDYTTSEMLGTDGGYVGDEISSMEENYYKGNMNTSTIAIFIWGDDGSYYGSNNWNASDLNTINLNTNYINYINNIDTKWVNMIATTTWYLGSMDYENYTSKEYYEFERSNNTYDDNPTTDNAKIGLMYVSDYGYAASPENWTTGLTNYNNDANRNNNWMYMGSEEWTITTFSTNYYNVYTLYYDGILSGQSAGRGGGNTARPVFYLESSVSITGGTGASNNPYRLSVN